MAISEPPFTDPKSLPSRRGTTVYPGKLSEPVAGRNKTALGDALGLQNFGVNLVRLEPGAASALRHWHTRQDEFIYVLAGEITLVTDAGAQVLAPGTIAGFPAGVANGHHLVNRSARDATYLEVGDRMPGDAVRYPDDDLVGEGTRAGYRFTHKDGTPY
ncbi:MAG: cupin domain-containing protein [Alphaproteobacteria bacterium]|nr:cupin domain-containing protein [Alphaproteobacteria bacterium]